MYTYEYYVPEYGEDASSYSTFKSAYVENEMDLVVEEMCHNYFPYYWEYKAPSEVFIRLEGTEAWKEFSIEVETVPAFYITEKE